MALIWQCYTPTIGMMMLYRKMAVISYALLDYSPVLDQITEYLLHPAQLRVSLGEVALGKGMGALSFNQGGVENGLAKWRKGRFRGDM